MLLFCIFAELLTGVDDRHANLIRTELEKVPELTSMEYRERVHEVSKVLRKVTYDDDVWRIILDNLLADQTPCYADCEIEADPKVQF